MRSGRRPPSHFFQLINGMTLHRTTRAHLRATYIGGPTALLELAGLRLLTDPTFDPAGSEYPAARYTLRKTQGPAVDADSLGPVDAVLLSHDHHFDNLDRSGRALLSRARLILTTPEGAERLGPPAVGLAPWQTIEIASPNGTPLRVTGTPARHGPAGGDRGPVTGFVLALADLPEHAVYISGDTVWYDGAAEVAQRFRVAAAFLFLGAARVLEVSPAHLTLTAHEGAEAARAFPHAVIVPLHYEGLAHFSEGRSEIAQAFAAPELAHRLRWLTPGEPVEIVLESHRRAP